MLIEEIYNKVYAQTEAGKQAEYNVTEAVSRILIDIEEKEEDVIKDEIKLEELLSQAAEAGLETGFKSGIRFALHLFAEAVF